MPAARPKEKKLTKLEKEAVDRAEAVAAAPSLPAAGGPRATLVVCPLSVMSNWQMQLEEHTAGNLKGEWSTCSLYSRVWGGRGARSSSARQGS